MKPTREEVLRLMRQASGGILTQVAEDPRCGYEIKVEELQTFAELLQAQNNSDHVDKPLAESAVASHECNGELDPQLAKDVARMFLQYVEGFNGQKFDPIFDSPDRQHLAVALDYLQEAAAMLLNLSERVIPSGMQPPNNQPNSDHVAVISAKPDSVHLAVPTETSTDTSLKTWPERIWLQHGDSPDVPEFSEVADAVTWCVDQIESSDVEYVRADLQSGISSPSHRPNEKNAVVIDESDLKLAFFDGYAAAVEDARLNAAPVIEFAWKSRQEGK